MYKKFAIKYGPDPDHCNSWHWDRKGWYAFVDDKLVGRLDASDAAWFAVFTAAGIPQSAHVRLREYKKLVSRISYHYADDSGKEWDKVPPLKAQATRIAEELVAEDLKLLGVVANLRKGELG